MSTQPDIAAANANSAPSTDGQGIAVSITNERGEHVRYRANAVSLNMTRGVLQIVEQAQGCFAWFEQCHLEVRDGRQNVLFRLLAGSASSSGNDLTIIAEIAREPSAAPSDAPPVVPFPKTSKRQARNRTHRPPGNPPNAASSETG